MSDVTQNAELARAVDLLQQALDAFKRGVGIATPNEVKEETVKPQPRKADPAKTEETMTVVPDAEPKATEESTPVSIDEIRKVFAKILLDTKVDGRSLIQKELGNRKAGKLSEVNPDEYFALITDVVSQYAGQVKKVDPAHFDEKIEEMKTWSIPF